MRTVFVIAVFVACLGCATAVHVPLVRSQLRPLRTQFDTTPTAPPLYLRQSLADFLTQSGADVAQATTANLPLNGSVWPVGGFETAIYVGTPPQVQLVQIDTGSADLLVAQQGCKACPSPKYARSGLRFVWRAAAGTTACSCAVCGGGMRPHAGVVAAGTTLPAAVHPAQCCATRRISSAGAALVPQETCAFTTTRVRVWHTRVSMPLALLTFVARLHRPNLQLRQPGGELQPGRHYVLRRGLSWLR